MMLFPVVRYATDIAPLPNHPVPVQLHACFFLTSNKENNHAHN